MPTAATAEPVAPGQARTPSQSVAFGRAQWTRKWRTFAAQWSQPQLMKLAAATLGEAALHSSQIHGFSTGKLRDPAPKVLLAIGQLNLAIAAANQGLKLPKDQPSCPMTMDDLWSPKKWMTDSKGEALGPLECFAAFTGMLDLGLDVRSGSLCEEVMPAVSKSIGKYLRFKLMEQGHDCMEIGMGEAENPEGALLQRLIFNKTLKVIELENAEQTIANACGVPVDQLWDEAVMPAIAAN